MFDIGDDPRDLNNLDLIKMLEEIEQARKLRKFIMESNKIEKVTDVLEIKYSIKAFKKIKKITVASILQVHKTILTNLDPEIAGKFRDQVVYVGGRTCPKEDLEERLDILCSFPPETSLGLLEWHIKFEKIHPFLDGNGRAGRLIYYWQCIKIGIPPLTFSKNNLEWYYGLFNDD